MRADFKVVLDACVLLPMPLADTLLRMAEHPRLYLPRWTEELMDEVSRNLVHKFHKTPEQALHRKSELQKAFPSAWVESGYQELIPCMSNDPKDKHVLAAAVRSGSEVIVTYNKKDFSRNALDRFGITCKGPSSFLIDLYDLDPPMVTLKLSEQAETLRISIEDLLNRLRNAAPSFVDLISGRLELDLG